MGPAPAGPGRPPNHRPPQTGPRRPGVGAGTVPNPTPRRARPRQSGTARRSGPAPAVTAGRRAAPGLAGTVPGQPGRVRRQLPVRQAAPAPRRAGPRPAGPTPAPSRPAAGPPNQSAGGAAAQRASLRIRNLILTTGVPKSASLLAARRPDPRRSSRPQIRGRRTRWAGTVGPAAGLRCGKCPRSGPRSTTRWRRPALSGRLGRRGRRTMRWPRRGVSGRLGRRGRAGGQGGAAAAGSS
jgi:translation initiation factor IF-2